MRARAMFAILWCALAVVPAPSVASAERETMIVPVSWLASHLKDPNLVLLHVGAREGYDAGHIPGARFISTADISLPKAEGALALELPPIDALDATFEALGVSDTSRIVVYFGEDWVTPTARVYFVLDYLGLGDRTSMLNGGMPAWKAAGHTVTADLPSIAKGRLTPKPRTDLVVGQAWVKAHLSDKRVAVLDARTEQFYSGASAGDQMRAGHIPGAKSLPFAKLVVDPQLTFVDAAAMRQLFRDADAASGDTVVPYCHIGQQASLVYFAARYLGYDVRLYDGSFQEWSRDADLQVEK